MGAGAFVPGQDLPAYRADAGPKPQFLALAPWVVPNAGRARLRTVGASLATGHGPYHYVQTAVIADLPFPAPAHRPGCLRARR